MFPSATLPIDFDDGLSMNPVEARSLGEFLSAEYAGANPFPHIVVDDFLPPALAKQVVANFPSGERESDRVFNIGYGGEHKRQITPEDCNRFSRDLFQFFNSRPVLQFLEGLTGISGLLPDPYFEGGGFHEISRGGRLGVHADFRVNDRLSVQRRLNLLVYLNETWEDEWKGHLELWSRDMKACVVKVAPLINRCVVFSTEADTWHGHPDPLEIPEGMSRKSMALYYYTASRAIYEETPDVSTQYVSRPQDSKADKKEAWRFRREEYLRQWLPPVGYRALARARRVIGRIF
jgi:hypothetical protein